VRRLAGPPLRALSEDTNETACLAVRDRDDLVVVEVIEPGDRFVQVNYRIGFRHPLGVAAHGKALLAFLPEGARDPSLQPSASAGWPTPATSSSRARPASRRRSSTTPARRSRRSASSRRPRACPSPRRSRLRVLRSAREISERLGWRPAPPTVDDHTAEVVVEALAGRSRTEAFAREQLKQLLDEPEHHERARRLVAEVIGLALTEFSTSLGSTDALRVLFERHAATQGLTAEAVVKRMAISVLESHRRRMHALGLDDLE
jgi:hypothetical protein